jgi:cation diffusion facilitator CzcD-associated flavoprotein CzcO
LLAPAEPPHPIGSKRPSLEQNFYEMFNLPHVDLVDLNAEPIEEFNETGIRTSRGFEEFDLIVLATGFDSVTGSLAQLDIRDTKGNTIAEHWKEGLRTAFGLSLAGFPNMFYLYGPQAPTALCNGPSCVQVQATWIKKVLKGLIEKGLTRFEAKPEKEVEWTKLTHEFWYSTLLPRAKGWWSGEMIICHMTSKSWCD